MNQSFSLAKDTELLKGIFQIMLTSAVGVECGLTNKHTLYANLRAPLTSLSLPNICIAMDKLCAANMLRGMFLEGKINMPLLFTRVTAMLDPPVFLVGAVTWFVSRTGVLPNKSIHTLTVHAVS